MPKTLLVATQNPHKVMEIKAKISNSGVNVVSLHDLHDFTDPPEPYATFEENAAFKALEAHKRHNLPVLADDSGLCVDHLNGAPGVRSKRFSPDMTDEANNRQLLKAMEGSTNRRAHFVCVLAYVDETGGLSLYRGELHGFIAEAACGTHGFGYDPIFIVEESHKHLAELDLDEKNRLSHRAKAIEAWWNQWRNS
jgi:XTP/dITP diphosphohydrolase